LVSSIHCGPFNVLVASGMFSCLSHGLTEVHRTTSGPLTASSPSQLTELGPSLKLNRYILMIQIENRRILLDNCQAQLPVRNHALLA